MYEGKSENEASDDDEAEVVEVVEVVEQVLLWDWADVEALMAMDILAAFGVVRFGREDDGWKDGSCEGWKVFVVIVLRRLNVRDGLLGVGFGGRLPRKSTSGLWWQG